jgi:hypothetical protein
VDDNVTLYAVGDILPHRDTGDFLLAQVASGLNQADITFCQIETPFSAGELRRVGHSELLAGSKDVAALVKAGFDVCSFASNHCYWARDQGILDTMDVFGRNNIRVIGVGKNIAEARQPAILERRGTKVAFLAYNSVLAPNSEARADKPGCVPVRVSTKYEQVDWQPGTPPRIDTSADKDDLSAMVGDIRSARQQADVVVVSIHWGVHLVPAAIAMYQYEVGHAAVDAGADLILGHHPHILKGIEVYKNRVIFYSMGNFAFFSPVLGARSTFKPLYKVKADPDYPNYFFPPDCRKSILVKVVIAKKKIETVSFVPVMINGQAQPELLSPADQRSTQVYDYVVWTCTDQNLNTSFSRQGDEVVVVTSSQRN